MFTVNVCAARMCVHILQTPHCMSQHCIELVHHRFLFIAVHAVVKIMIASLSVARHYMFIAVCNVRLDTTGQSTHTLLHCVQLSYPEPVPPLWIRVVCRGLWVMQQNSVHTRVRAYCGVF